MREQFEAIRFQDKTLKVIEQADEIIRSYRARGFTLTLRQLYYQFVARDLIPNKQTEYKRLGKIVNEARLAGLLDWSGIEDRTRNVKSQASWDSPSEIMRAVAAQYKEDPWQDQRYAPEIWIEKDALVGVIEPVCREYMVPYFACRGYASQSELYDAGKRFANHRAIGKTPVIFHLGDHDPSGLDMTRDVTRRIRQFARTGTIQVERLALNMDQINRYDPPPNPAKDTDARFEDYAAQYGDSSWELDALDPDVIGGLIRNALDQIIDSFNWKQSMRNEAKNRADLQMVSREWGRVVEGLGNERDNAQDDLFGEDGESDEDDGE